MAKNAPIGDGCRVGAVRGRSQAYNPKNGKWIKRDSDTGKFMVQKGAAFQRSRERAMNLIVGMAT